MRDSRFAVRRPPSVARRTSLTGERPSRARHRPRALCFLLPAGVCCARVGGPCVEVRGFAVHGARFAGSDDKVRPAWRRDWITTRARPRVHTRPSSSPLVVQSSCVRCSPVVRSFVRSSPVVRQCRTTVPPDHASGRSGCPTQQAWRTRIVAGADAVRAQTRSTRLGSDVVSGCRCRHAHLEAARSLSSRTWATHGGCCC